MALIHTENKEELKEELDELENQVNEEEKDEKVATIGSWIVSGTIHALILLLLSAFIFLSDNNKVHAPIKLVALDPIEQPTPTVDRDIIEETPNVVIHTEEVTSEINIISDLEVIDPVEEIEREDVTDANDAKGRSDAVAVSENGGSFAFRNIGAGGAASGAFGRTLGGDRNRIGRAFGPNAKGVVSTIDDALMWLVRHQSPDGRWDSDAYNINCEDNPKMEPGNNVGGADEAMTGYALLCFLGSGYDHKTPSKYRRTVQRGVEWLVSIQKQDGLFGNRNYEHAVATMAIAESFAMTQDMQLRDSAQRGVNIILQRQVQSHDGYPLAWDYVNPNLNRIDISVSGWPIMALKSAKVGGLDVGNGLEGGRRFVEGAWKAANPNWMNLTDPYTDKSIFPYTWNVSQGTTQKEHLSFVGAMCSVFLGENNGSIMLQTLANDMTDRWFTNNRYRQNSYCLYYVSLSAFQIGGRHWVETWGHPENGFAPWLISTLNRGEQDGCRKGTWNHEKENWHGSDTSPVLLHCYKLLALSVAIRYVQQK